MYRYDERGELAPRDVVSRAIVREAARTGSEDMYLDIRFRGGEFIRNRFPMIYERCLEEGVDITKELIPVFPCQHYLMGGIDVGVYGDTTVDRLYAAGNAPIPGSTASTGWRAIPCWKRWCSPAGRPTTSAAGCGTRAAASPGRRRPADGGPALASRAPHRDPPDHAKGLVRPA